MNSDQGNDILSLKLERIRILADILLSFVETNQQALVLTEIIMETALLPEV